MCQFHEEALPKNVLGVYFCEGIPLRFVGKEWEKTQKQRKCQRLIRVRVSQRPLLNNPFVQLLKVARSEVVVGVGRDRIWPRMAIQPLFAQTVHSAFSYFLTPIKRASNSSENAFLEEQEKSSSWRGSESADRFPGAGVLL